MSLQGVKLGTYWDLGLSDNYITKKMARRLGLKGADVEIEMEGIMKTKHLEKTKLYNLQIIDETRQVHIVQAYGLDKVTSGSEIPEKEGYLQLCEEFGVHLLEVAKPL